MEAFFPCLAKIFMPIALLCLACWVILALTLLHAAADLAMALWLKRSRAELQQIVGQYQPDYVPYQAMTYHKILKYTRPLIFYPLLALALIMIVVCTVGFPTFFRAISHTAFESQSTSFSFKRAWVNPFTGTISFRGVATARINDEHMDFDVQFEAVDLDLRLLSMFDPIHRYDRLATYKATGSLAHISNVAKTIDPALGVIISSVRAEDSHCTLVDLSMSPAPGQPLPDIRFDIQVNQLTIEPFRTLHPAFDLMTNVEATGTIDGKPCSASRTLNGVDQISTMHFESIDLTRFRYYLRSIMPQIAAGTIDIDVVQKIDHDPAAKVAIESKYTFHNIKTHPVDSSVVVNPKAFGKVSEFLTKNSSEFQIPITINLDRKTYENAASFHASGALTLQRKAVETVLINKVLKDVDMTQTPQGQTIENIKSLIPPPSPSTGSAPSAQSPPRPSKNR